jgi:hypothetical protein
MGNTTTTTTTTTTDNSTIEALDKAMNDLSTYLNGTSGDPTSNLKGNWIFLQIYATYGLRLPNTSALLGSALNLTSSEAAAYPWFSAMYSSYNTVNLSSTYFFSDVFDKMTSLGSGLQSYASDVAGQDSTFTLVSSLIKPTDGSAPDLVSALDILSDLKTSAASNATLAGDIKANLATYKTKLVNAQSGMATVKDSVDSDDRTSQEAITKLNGGPEVIGSLDQLNKMLKDEEAEYKHDVIVASTTVTYAWVAPPFGLIAAASVAGVYGKKAVDMKDTIDKLEAQIKTAGQSLKVAVATQNTVKLAEGSLDSVIKYTDLAIAKTTLVQNSWQGVAAGLTDISGKVSASIKMEDGAEKLAAINAVVYFMKKAQQKWTEIQPTINDMVTDPYITVSPTPQTLSEFANEVVAEAEKIEAGS